jgi:hypothetical protein
MLTTSRPIEKSSLAGSESLITKAHPTPEEIELREPNLTLSAAALMDVMWMIVCKRNASCTRSTRKPGG